LDAARKTLGMLTSYYVLMFVLILLLALALPARSAALSSMPQVLIRPATWWAYPLLLAGVVLIVLHTNLRVIHADMVYKQAEPYESQGMWDFAIALRQESIKLAPQEDLYYLFLGRAFLEKAKTAPGAEGPAQVFTVAQALNLTPPQIAQLSREDLLGLSELVLQRAREINPLNTDHSANLGRLYRTKAELSSDPAERRLFLSRALEAYEQASSLSPNAAHLYDEWGLVYFVAGDHEAAIDKYEYSLTIDDQYVNTYLSLGDAYLATDDLDKAREAYLKAIEIDPTVAEVHSVLAYLYGKEGRIEEAISETLQVVELARSQSLLYNSYKNLALFYQEQGRLEEAMHAAQEALARAPEAERAGIEGLIAQLGAGGAVPQTEVLIQQALADGEAALNGKDWGRAEEAYGRALALNPDLVVGHSALAYIYAQQGRLEEAEQENRLVLAAIPDDYATLKNLAIIYRQLDRYEDSLLYARQALEAPQALPQEQEQLRTFIAELEKLQ
jgi:tetratricopeptide (TPR) repeat protein